MAFKVPTLRELIKQMTEDAERESGSAQLRMSNLRVLPKVFAFAVYGLYAYIRYIAAQLFADTAEDEYLIRQASIQGLYLQPGESMKSLKQRLLDRLRNPPRGGTASDYVYWAKEIEGVTRAWCFPKEQGIGTVVVRFCTDGLTENGIPTEGKVAEVQAHIEENAPIPASITVVAPQAQVVNFTISDLLPSNDTIKEKIKAELEALLIREGAPGQILYRSHIEQAISSVDGEENHVLVSPSDDVVCGNTKVLVMGEVSYVET